MKRNIILLLIFLFVFHSKTKSQNDIRTIDINKIEHPFFKDILTAYYGKTSLPFFQDKRKTVKYMQKNRPYTRYAYIGNNVDPDLPLYINPDKRDKEKNEKENAIIALFYETNGDYMIAILWTISNDHNAVKYLITTFDLHGKQSIG